MTAPFFSFLRIFSTALAANGALKSGAALRREEETAMHPTRKPYPDERSGGVAVQSDSALPSPAVSPLEPGSASDLTINLTPGPPAGPATKRDTPAAFGRYQVRNALGAGGFGAVYLCHDTQLDRPVAVKVLRGGPEAPQAKAEQFLQEARRLAQLSHPGIVTVHDVGLDGGQVYIVSDFLEGPDLGRWLKDNRPSWHGGGPDRSRRGRRLGPRPRPAHRSPRRQAGEHHHHARSRPRPRRLRARPRRGGGGRLRTRRHLRHPGVHGTGAGRRRGAQDRRSHRHLQPGRGALRDALRPLAVPGEQHPRTAQAGERRRAAAPASAPPRNPARVGAGLPQVAREAAPGPIHHRVRLRRRPEALCSAARGSGFLTVARATLRGRADRTDALRPHPSRRSGHRRRRIPPAAAPAMPSAGR